MSRNKKVAAPIIAKMSRETKNGETEVKEEEKEILRLGKCKLDFRTKKNFVSNYWVSQIKVNKPYHSVCYSLFTFI